MRRAFATHLGGLILRELTYPLQEVDAEDGGGRLLRGGRFIRTLRYVYVDVYLYVFRVCVCVCEGVCVHVCVWCVCV